MNRPLLIVSNRLPIVIKNEDETWTIAPGSGGLITALKPVLKEYGGSWVGWPGDVGEAPIDDLLGKLGDELGCSFKPVALSAELVEGFYYGFSNETLWPLFHDLLGHAEFNESKWRSYQQSNEIFADVLSESVKHDHIVWVHDYQLILVGEHLRRRGMANPLVYFLHIPFPSPDIYARLPWRAEILRAMLAYDLVGFQSKKDLRNFARCVAEYIPDATVKSAGGDRLITWQGRTIRAGAFPISIDARDFDHKARAKDVQDAAWYIHENFGDQMLIIGVDRLDYTKGIPIKFRALERALEKYPDLIGKISLIQLVVPSRQDIPEYAMWKEKLDQLAGEINGRFALRGWVPVHYMYRSLPMTELLGYYRACEISLITPLRDGMNLVCKEYCASSVDENGVLILSEFAGAAPQLKDGALIVNPHDLEAVADAIHRAYVMSREERQTRMHKLREGIMRNDVFKWVRDFLASVERLEKPKKDQGAKMKDEG